jgi:peptide deformylase
MRETMHHAQGVGLAAPQIDKSIRLFLVNTAPFSEDEDLDVAERQFLANFNKVFINAKIIKEEGDEWAFTEGCLSIPDIREDVFRPSKITIEYFDENFEKHTDVVDGLAARVIQHEYDHIEGILFTDKISSLKKRLLKKKLENISKGKVEADYRMKFPSQKRK